MLNAVKISILYQRFQNLRKNWLFRFLLSYFRQISSVHSASVIIVSVSLQTQNTSALASILCHLICRCCLVSNSIHKRCNVPFRMKLCKLVHSCSGATGHCLWTDPQKKTIPSDGPFPLLRLSPEAPPQPNSCSKNSGYQKRCLLFPIFLFSLCFVTFTWNIQHPEKKC